MISVITPTYETDPDTLARTWNSLKKQTYTDWEWVVWDDSANDNVFNQVYGFCSDERYKIQLHRSPKNIGIIGMVKLSGFSMANGDILVELDHDDELTSDALEAIAEAFQDPEVGFVYSNWCEINQYGQSCKYPEGWAFGYGSEYYDDEHDVWVMRAPALNFTTMSHIVSAPNHVRAWRAETYRDIGGHNPTMRVADDYELMVRTMLHTKPYHIDRLLYKQYIHEGTAQRVYNGEIQANVSKVARQYADLLEERYNGSV